MKNIRWVLQNNLIAENDRAQLQEACKEIGVEFYHADIKKYVKAVTEYIGK